MKKIKSIYLTKCLKVVYKVDFISCCLIAILKIVGALVPTLQTLVIAEFINNIATGNDNLLNDPYIRMIILFMIGLVAYTWISRSVIELLSTHVEMKLNAEFKPKLIEKISRLKYRFMEDGDTRDKINRVNSNVSTKVKDAYLAILGLVELILEVAGIVIIIFTQVWWAALPILAIAVPCFYISIKSGKAGYDAEAKVSKEKRVNEYYNEMLKNREYTDERTLFQYQDTFNDRFIKQYEKARKFKTRVRLKWYIRMKIGSMATIIVSAVMIAIFVPLTLNESLSIGMFMALTNAVFSIVQNMSWDLTKAIDRNTWFNEYFKDMDSIWNMQEDNECFEEKKNVHVFESLEFKNVSFKYPGTEKYVLKDLSFRICKGKNYAFVGVNGAGKSTIVKLINGLYKEYEGQILVNGKDICECSRSFINTIFQDFAKYPISIKDNIAISRQDTVEDKEIEQILEQVELNRTVSKFENGVNTVLGKYKKNSVDVSGGEWQQIALARCAISNATVKILDEPTAAVDPIYETMIYKKFKEISINKTIILISHRLAAVQMSDIIYVLDSGTIVEGGTHAKLVQQGGLYETMYKEQEKWYQEDKRRDEDYE